MRKFAKYLPIKTISPHFLAKVCTVIRVDFSVRGFIPYPNYGVKKNSTICVKLILKYLKTAAHNMSFKTPRDIEFIGTIIEK